MWHFWKQRHEILIVSSLSGMTREREGKEKENQTPDDCWIATILLWPWCFAKLILLSSD
jgi:hypothetical protein